MEVYLRERHTGFLESKFVFGNSVNVFVPQSPSVR
jgi:hypothetical protein